MNIGKNKHNETWFGSYKEREIMIMYLISISYISIGISLFFVCTPCAKTYSEVINSLSFSSILLFVGLGVLYLTLNRADIGIKDAIRTIKNVVLKPE
ncbi:MAG: hypothetical protein Fur0024_3860 [Patescibacteria group bacterium]